MAKIFLFSLWLVLTVGCASAPKTPPGGPNDTLVFFYIDKTEMSGKLDRIYFHDAKSEKYINATYDPKLATGFIFVPAGGSYYVDQLNTLGGGFSGPQIIRSFTIQNSAIKVTAGAKRALKFAGAFKYREAKHGVFEVPDFTLEKCDSCSTEATQLRNLLELARGNQAQLLTPEWTALIERRLREVSK